MSEEVKYSIRDLQELSGIPAHTIRTWERRYGLLTPSRDRANARWYGAGDIAFLSQLSLLLGQGHRISTLAGKPRQEISALAAEASLTAQEAEITETLCMALREFDVQKAEGLVSCIIRREGFEPAMQSRFIPLIEGMDFLILSGVLQPIHIPIFYGILRQKVQTATDAIPLQRDGGRWVLLEESPSAGRPEGDILQYLLRKKGHHVINIGAMSVAETLAIMHKVQPQGLCFIAGPEGTSAKLSDLSGLLSKHEISQGNTLILLQGKTLNSVNISQIPGATIYPGLRDAFKHLSNA
jgi:MerR family transcriptional regulator, light-induced transcriptional regulator